MSQDAEKVKKLITFRKKLEEKINDLELELEELRAMLETVNAILLERGFKRVEIAKPPTEAEALPPKEEVTVEHPYPQAGYESLTQLKTVTGELLANLYISGNSLRVVPAEDKDFNINTPPFTPFLVERVLAKMQEKDRELAETGQLPHDKTFSYNIVREGDVIREIIIKNFDENRLRELKSSIRWTLEKMYEKTKSQS